MKDPANARATIFSILDTDGESMEMIEGLNKRKSIRGFRPDPVPLHAIRTILQAAARSPSYTNSQPWEVAVVTGDKRDQLSSLLYHLAAAGTPAATDLPDPKGSWPEAINRRTQAHHARRFEFLDIKRDDAEKRDQFRLQNFKFFGAPCVMFFFLDKSLGPWSLIDIGIFIQSVSLAAQGLGLGCCMQASLANYPDQVRSFLNIPDHKKLIVGMSLGYPDHDIPINQYISSREDIDAFTRWHA